MASLIVRFYIPCSTPSASAPSARNSYYRFLRRLARRCRLPMKKKILPFGNCDPASGFTPNRFCTSHSSPEAGLNAAKAHNPLNQDRASSPYWVHALRVPRYHLWSETTIPSPLILCELLRNYKFLYCGKPTSLKHRLASVDGLDQKDRLLKEGHV